MRASSGLVLVLSVLIFLALFIAEAVGASIVGYRVMP